MAKKQPKHVALLTRVKVSELWFLIGPADGYETAETCSPVNQSSGI